MVLMVLLQGHDEASEKNITFSTFADMLFMRKVFFFSFALYYVVFFLLLDCDYEESSGACHDVIKKERHFNTET